jgi:hypothetical protein
LDNEGRADLDDGTVVGDNIDRTSHGITPERDR